MTFEAIENAIQKNAPGINNIVKISFKTRNAIKGIFIKTSDYHELSRKNLWRIVSEIHIDNYIQTHDVSLARIFNGTEFTRLEAVS